MVGDERDLVNKRNRLLKTAFNCAFPRIWHVGYVGYVLLKGTPISHGVEKILLIVRCSITAKSRKVQGDENILLWDFLKYSAQVTSESSDQDDIFQPFQLKFVYAATTWPAGTCMSLGCSVVA